MRCTEAREAAFRLRPQERRGLHAQLGWRQLFWMHRFFLWRLFQLVNADLEERLELGGRWLHPKNAPG
jgi:hypothetical protein